MWVLLLNILSCYKNKQSHKTNTFCNQVRMFFLKTFRGQRHSVQYFLLRVFLRVRNSVDMVSDLDIPTISSYTCLCVEIPCFFKWKRGIKALLPFPAISQPKAIPTSLPRNKYPYNTPDGGSNSNSQGIGAVNCCCKDLHTRGCRDPRSTSLCKWNLTKSYLASVSLIKHLPISCYFFLLFVLFSLTFSHFFSVCF